MPFPDFGWEEMIIVWGIEGVAVAAMSLSTRVCQALKAEHPARAGRGTT
jgi:hypothetical protein